MKVVKFTALLTLIAIILIFGLLVTEIYNIEYFRLSLSISYGKTLYLYPRILSILSISIMVLAGGFLILYRCLSNNLLINTMLLLVSNIMMFAIIGFLSQGYVVGDQPRAEFALGALISEGKLILKEAEHLSGYFHWPALWIHTGIFSAITKISSFESPVLLMVTLWFVLGITLTVMVKRIHGVKDFCLANSAFIIYSILNPYKIIHACPQIYALVLFIIVTVLLFKRQVTLSNSIAILLLAMTIILSHPLTSVIIVAILLTILIRNFVMKYTKTALWTTAIHEGLVFAVLIFFIAWNIRYEDLIRNIALELAGEVQLQTLEPIASQGLYLTDTFYIGMALYRYIGLFLMSILALLALLMHRDNRVLRELFFITFATFVGSLLLNIIPGRYFHRILYYLVPFVAVISAGSLDIRRLIVTRSEAFIKVLSISAMLLLPLLAQLSVAEFLTNNNPVVTLNSPFEFSLYKFVGDFYTYSDYTWSVSSGAINYYMVLSQGRSLSPYVLSTSATLRAIHLVTYLRKEDLNAVESYFKIVYSARFFIVSPRERYVFYERTNFENFYIIDFYLNSNSNKIYDNRLLKLYGLGT